MNKLTFLLLLILGLSLLSCSRPTTGTCAHCPVWFFDPICLTGGDGPDPIKPKVHAPPPVESDLIPGQEDATYKKKEEKFSSS